MKVRHEMPEIWGFAVEMALEGRESEPREGVSSPALRAWKAAQNAAFQIPTATAAAA
jgi:Uma2 family endonuclease